MPANDVAAVASLPSPRERIIAAARRLFAEKGLHGAAMREIAREASVNVNLVTYHFSTKEDLYVHVMEVTAQRLNARRNVILEDMEHRSAPGVPPVSDIMYAFVHPVFELIQDSPGVWNDFISAYRREMSTPLWHQINTPAFAPVLRRFVTALHRSLPSARRSDVVFTLEFATHTLSIAADTVATSILGEALTADRAPEQLESQMIRALTAVAVQFS